MKTSLSSKAILLSFALSVFITVAITFYVGFSADSRLAAVSTQNFFINTFLVNITFMGDAFFAFGIIFFLIFFFNKKSIALNLLVAVLISITLTQFIKNIFSGLALQLFFEEGVLQNPREAIFSRNIISSHTAVIFTLAVFFVLQAKNLLIKVMLFAMAFIVAITRMELAGDSLMAIALGLLPASAAVLYLYTIKHKKVVSNNSYYYKSRKERKTGGQQFLRV